MPVAGEGYFADILHGFEHLFDLLVDDLADLFLRAVAGHHNGQNRVGVRIYLLDNRWESVSRKSICDRGDLIAHILDGFLDVSLEDKGDHHLREPLLGRRSQFIDARDCVYDLFHRFRDLSLDLFGAGSRKACAHKNHRSVRFGH
jgi:hypothetical protein